MYKKRNGTADCIFFRYLFETHENYKKLLSEIDSRNHQAGFEYKKLFASEDFKRKESDINERNINTVITSESGVRSSVTEVSVFALKEKEARKNIHISTSRQTFSFLDSISVEDQVLHVFCEQVRRLALEAQTQSLA